MWNGFADRLIQKHIVSLCTKGKSQFSIDRIFFLLHLKVDFGKIDSKRISN